MATTNGRSTRCGRSSNRATSLLAAVLTLFVVFEQALGYGEIVGNWEVDYGLSTPELHIERGATAKLTLTIFNVKTNDTQEYYFRPKTVDERYAILPSRVVVEKQQISADGRWVGTVEVRGLRFGYAELYVALYWMESMDSSGIMTYIEAERSPQTLSVAVLRKEGIDESVFTWIAFAVVVLMFLNLGTVLDLQRLVAICRMPISPLIGLLNRYLLMPALGLALGYMLFSSQKPLLFALFCTALAPSGGLANIATIFLKGNINLSVATSTVNSLLALGLVPLWLLFFKHVVYDGTQELSVPYGQLAVAAVAIIAALVLGILLRLCIPRTTRFIFLFLKPLSIILSLALVALTVGMNAFAFEQYTWRVLLASLCLPVLGYVLAWLDSRLLCRSATDALTLAIEASMLNMSLPIVLLQYSIAQPQLDLILVVPIASSLTSLLLVVIFYAVRRCCGWNVAQDQEAFDARQLLTVDNANY